MSGRVDEVGSSTARWRSSPAARRASAGPRPSGCAAGAGANVVVADLDDAQGGGTVGAINATGGEAVFVRVDVADPEQVAAMVSTAVDGFGRLDITVATAPVCPAPTPRSTTSVSTTGSARSR